jgi:hypothetical protein
MPLLASQCASSRCSDICNTTTDCSAHHRYSFITGSAWRRIIRPPLFSFAAFPGPRVLTTAAVIQFIQALHHQFGLARHSFSQRVPRTVPNGVIIHYYRWHLQLRLAARDPCQGFDHHPRSGHAPVTKDQLNCAGVSSSSIY